MNIQRFVLPATIAAAFHAALLYGFPHDAIVIGPAIVLPEEKTVTDCPEPIEIVVPPLEVDEPIPEVAPVAKGTPRPESDEVFRELKDAVPIVVNPIQNQSRPIVRTERIGPPGVPEGTGPEGQPREFGKTTTWAKFLDHTPRAKVQMAPDYPSDMKKNGFDGTVTVEFEVDPKGRVVSAQVRHSTDRAFEEPTLRAVLKWRFEPGLVKGIPVSFRMVIPVNFKLGAD